MTAYAGPEFPTNGLSVLLDSFSSRSYPGTGTAWNNISGVNLNGLLVNNPTFISTNPKYFTFNGTTQYVSLANGSSLSPLNSRNITINSWIRLTAYSPNYSGEFIGQIISTNSNSVSNAGFLFAVNGTASSWNGLRVFANANAVNNFQSFNFNLNQWYNLCLTRTSAGLYTYYVNGEIIGTHSNAASWTDNAIYYIGYNDVVGFRYYFPGFISTIHVYNNAALLPVQVQHLFNAYRGRYGV